MGYFVKALIFIGASAFFAWFFYNIFISTTSRFGFIGPDEQSYQKNSGTIVEKENAAGSYRLTFTYPEEENLYKGVLIVSEHEFNRARIGDKIPIFYGIHDASKWLPIKTGKVYWGGVALVIATLVCFLVGTSYLYRAVRKTPVGEIEATH